jgi:hypothetical protein
VGLMLRFRGHMELLATASPSNSITHGYRVAG